jgi:hypothetical protein
MKYIIRLLALPFVFAITFIALFMQSITKLFHFMKYGGELTAYPKSRKTIADVYNLVEEDIKIRNRPSINPCPPLHKISQQ